MPAIVGWELQVGVAFPFSPKILNVVNSDSFLNNDFGGKGL
jgi:hypothetical protein